MVGQPVEKRAGQGRGQSRRRSAADIRAVVKRKGVAQTSMELSVSDQSLLIFGLRTLTVFPRPLLSALPGTTSSRKPHKNFRVSVGSSSLDTRAAAISAARRTSIRVEHETRRATGGYPLRPMRPHLHVRNLHCCSRHLLAVINEP